MPAKRKLEVITIKDYKFTGKNLDIDSFKATVIKKMPVRKKFEEGRLVCFSRNGVLSANNYPCSVCNDTLCQVRLRLVLLFEKRYYLLEVPYSSAKRFYEYLAYVELKGRSLKDTTTTLSLERINDAWIVNFKLPFSARK